MFFCFILCSVMNIAHFHSVCFRFLCASSNARVLRTERACDGPSQAKPSQTTLLGSNMSSSWALNNGRRNVHVDFVFEFVFLLPSFSHLNYCIHGFCTQRFSFLLSKTLFKMDRVHFLFSNCMCTSEQSFGDALQKTETK